MVVKTVKRHNKLLKQRGSAYYEDINSALKALRPVQSKNTMIQQLSNKSLSTDQISSEILKMLHKTTLDDFIKLIIDTSDKSNLKENETKKPLMQRFLSRFGKRNSVWYKQLNKQITEFYKKIEDNYDTIMPLEGGIKYLAGASDILLVKILLALLYIKITIFSIDAKKKNNITTKLLEYYEKNENINNDNLIDMAQIVKDELYNELPGLDYKKIINSILTEFVKSSKANYINKKKKEDEAKAIRNAEYALTKK